MHLIDLFFSRFIRVDDNQVVLRLAMVLKKRTTSRRSKALLGHLTKNVREIWLCMAIFAVGCSSCLERKKLEVRQENTTPQKTIQEAIANSSQQTKPREEKVREPAFAGSWYPGDKAELSRYIDNLLDKAEPPPVSGKIVALISPHAGYIYSGRAAASGYKLIRGKPIKRVIVLAISHRVPIAGISIDDATHYRTPLGLIPVDTDAVRRLRKLPIVKNVVEAHQKEHSMELQLPWLERTLDHFSLVPILVGQGLTDKNYQEIAKAVGEIVDSQTLIVASSDFTHRGPNFNYEVPAGKQELKERLRRLDQGAVDEILQLNRKELLAYVKRTGATICGVKPIALLLEILANAENVKGKVVSHYTSADVTKDWTNTVSYEDIVFTGKWKVAVKPPPENAEGTLDKARHAGEKVFPLAREEKALLLRLARRSLEMAVRKGEYSPEALGEFKISHSLKRKAGAFVTLKCKLGARGSCVGKGEDLRGCIGTITPETPVAQTVALRAASAALDDPRFPSRVNVEELKYITVEVSVLTPPRTVSGPKEIVIGRHGIILRNGFRSATYLPQVAPEQGWDLKTTLSHLSEKAGLDADGWHDASFQVYEAIVFTEGHPF